MTINCNGQLIDLTVPKVMGILNLTPDSFYDGGAYTHHQAIIEHVGKMLLEGAYFIDVGAYSSRPSGTHISQEEELERLLPVLASLVKEFPDIRLSVDTFRSEVAAQAVDAGACMVNDISAGKLDGQMMATVARLGVPYIMMHMRGTPQTMQHDVVYEHLVKDILFYFSQRIAEATQLGIMDIIVDPGFGFSKTREQNFELLSQLEFFKVLDRPLLAGISRKSMVYKTLKTDAKGALNGTTVLNTVALQKKASILRVHDVREAVECIELIQQLENF